MPEPHCYMCGRRTRRFLSKFATQETYICRICENSVRATRQASEFPGKPDYGFSRLEFDGIPHQRKSKMMIYSYEELAQLYDEQILAKEDAYG